MQDNLIKTFEAFIMEQGFFSGDKLPGEIDLATRFNVSRSCIRETLKYFTQIGILERVKKKGTVLKTPSVADIGRNLTFQLKMLNCSFEEIKATRLLLETSLAADIIRNIRVEDLEQLTIKNQELASLENEPLRADIADQEFHMLLLNCCGNRLFQAFSQVIALIFDAKHRTKYHSKTAIQKSVRSHNAMLQAIRSQDTRGLIHVLKEHIKPL